MGKGDKKSKRGKIVIGSYGVRRSRKKNKKNVIAPKKAIEPKPKKAIIEKPVVVEGQVAEVVIPVETTEEVVEIKKTVKKPSAKKAAPKAEGEEEKPKVPRTRKKAADTPPVDETPAEG